MKSSGNSVTFNIPQQIGKGTYTECNVTIGVFLPNDYNNRYYYQRNQYYINFDGTPYSLGIIRGDLSSIGFSIFYGYYGYVENNTTYKLVTIPVKVKAGANHTISFNNTPVGLFYIKVTGATQSEVNSGNNAWVSLNDINVPSGTTLGLWKNFKLNGMNLYLGGWKYQSDSELAGKYTRHSEDYLDTSYDNDINYNDDDGNPKTDTPTKHDEWEHPETQYNYGNEDPYYRTEFSPLGSDGKFEIRRSLTQPPYSTYFTQYAYNTIDNGRNEYIESTGETTYTGRYLFQEAEDSKDWGKKVPGDPFTVPCMGDFIKLEPERDGTVTLYLMQNGSIDYDVSSYRKLEKDDDRHKVGNTTYGKYRGGLLSKVCWRPVFIVDEAGTRLSHEEVIAETNNFITIGRDDASAYVYDSNNKRAVLCVNKDSTQYATSNPAKMAERSDPSSAKPGAFVTDGNGNVVMRNGSILYANRFTYTKCFEALNSEYDIYGKKKSDSEYAADKAHYEFFTSRIDGIEVWPRTATNQISGVETSGTIVDNASHSNFRAMRGHVWGPQYTGDGWIIISKGYVKYQFHVKAGKSYYVFANDTKVGFSGYEFQPDRNYPYTEQGAVSLYDDKRENPALNSNAATSYSRVNLDGRIFNPGWNAICLPFSVTESKMREWFGTNGQETYELVTYNGVGMDEDENEDGTKETHRKAFFFHHVYQDIIAGYPYMLWIPEGAKALQSAWNGNVYFENVTIEPDAINNLWAPFTTSNDYMPKQVKRLYDIAPENCFTFTGFYSPTAIQKADYYVVPDGLQLYTNNEKQTSRGFRAFLSSNERANGVNEMVRLSGTNFTNVLDEMGEADWGNATVINGLAEDMGFFQQKQNVYSVSGQLIRANSTSLAGLPKGIYIVNGKKYFVK